MNTTIDTVSAILSTAKEFEERAFIIDIDDIAAVMNFAEELEAARSEFITFMTIDTEQRKKNLNKLTAEYNVEEMAKFRQETMEVQAICAQIIKSYRDGYVTIGIS